MAAAGGLPNGHLAVGAHAARDEEVGVDPRERRLRRGRRLDAIEELGEGARILWADGVEHAGSILLDQPNHPLGEVARVDDLDWVCSVVRGKHLASSRAAARAVSEAI